MHSGGRKEKHTRQKGKAQRTADRRQHAAESKSTTVPNSRDRSEKHNALTRQKQQTERRVRTQKMHSRTMNDEPKTENALTRQKGKAHATEGKSTMNDGPKTEMHSRGRKEKHTERRDGLR